MFFFFFFQKLWVNTHNQIKSPKKILARKLPYVECEIKMPQNDDVCLLFAVHSVTFSGNLSQQVKNKIENLEIKLLYIQKQQLISPLKLAMDSVNCEQFTYTVRTKVELNK